MKITEEQITKLRDLLAQPGRNIVIVAHTNPDGDAVGSSLAWAAILRNMVNFSYGKERPDD